MTIEIPSWKQTEPDRWELNLDFISKYRITIKPESVQTVGAGLLPAWVARFYCGSHFGTLSEFNCRHFFTGEYTIEQAKEGAAQLALNYHKYQCKRLEKLMKSGQVKNA